MDVAEVENVSTGQIVRMSSLPLLVSMYCYEAKVRYDAVYGANQKEHPMSDKSALHLTRDAHKGCHSPNIQPILLQREAHCFASKLQLVQVSQRRQVLREIGLGEPDSWRRPPKPTEEGRRISECVGMHQGLHP